MKLISILRFFALLFLPFLLAFSGDPDYAAKKKAADDFRSNFSSTEISSADDLHWTGNVKTCSPGKIAHDVYVKMLKRINYFRRIAGVHDDIYFDSSWNKMAQATAFLMYANNVLTHDATSSMKCFSKLAQTGAATSNISTIVDTSIKLLIADMIQDGGDENADCGHRRWILNSDELKMGIGVTPGAYALRVFHMPGTDDNDTSSWHGNAPEYFAYPFTGFIPYQVIYPKWSFSVPAGADFRNATVEASAGTKQLSCRIISRTSPPFGDPAMVWSVAGLKKDFDYNYYDMNEKKNAFQQMGLINQKITVKIDHVKIGGKEKSFRYAFTIIDPDDYK